MQTSNCSDTKKHNGDRITPCTTATVECSNFMPANGGFRAFYETSVTKTLCHLCINSIRKINLTLNGIVHL